MRMNWIGQTATAKESQVDSLRLLNAYPEAVASRQGKTAVALYGTPGLKRFLTLPGSGMVRGLYRASDAQVFAVMGSVLYQVTASGTASPLGTLQSTLTPVVFADNGLAMVLVDKITSGYMVNLHSHSFDALMTPNNTPADRVVFFDNRLLINKQGTQQYQWTDLVSTDIGGLNFQSVDGAPDLLLSMEMMHRELWLPGVVTTEVHADTGDADIPFARIQGAFVEMGIVGPHAIAKVGDTLIWVMQSAQGTGMVVQASGYNAQRISTHDVEQALQRYETLSDCLAWSQQQDGHLFCWLTFPSAGHTWVFDATSGLWHERGWRNPATGQVGRHRANCYAYAFGKHLVGDFEDGRVYELDSETYSDDGDTLLFEATLPPVFDANSMNRMRFDYLQIECATGVGLEVATNALGYDPQFMLLLSNDGGKTWPIERPKSMGKIGEYTTAVYWWQLGSAYDRRFKLRISDPVKRVILGANIEATMLGPRGGVSG